MEIKPCPFCGSNKCGENYQHGFAEGWVVRCNSCGANGQVFENEQDAIEQWNAVSLSCSGWQPLQTVPKDGSTILLRYFTSRFGRRVVEVSIWDCDARKIPGEATHWMPLPPPPNPHR